MKDRVFLKYLPHVHQRCRNMPKHRKRLTVAAVKFNTTGLNGQERPMEIIRFLKSHWGHDLLGVSTEGRDTYIVRNKGDHIPIFPSNHQSDEATLKANRTVQAVAIKEAMHPLSEIAQSLWYIIVCCGIFL